MMELYSGILQGIKMKQLRWISRDFAEWKERDPTCNILYDFIHIVLKKAKL